MSMRLIRLLRHPIFTYHFVAEINQSPRVCIHCSATHRCDESPPKDTSLQTVPRFIEKEQMISEAMKTYLERKKQHDAVLEKSIAEYDLGRRHLANIMGVAEEELNDKTIKEAIEYLLPSGLFNKKARPQMEHPSEIMASIGDAQFDVTGRPYHCLYYTGKPQYFQLMHDLAVALEILRSDYSRKVLGKKNKYLIDSFIEKKKVSLVGSEWVGFNRFQELFHGERVNEHDYNRLLVLLTRIVEQPLSYRLNKEVMKYRRKIVINLMTSEDFKPMLDEEGRKYMIAKGSRKKSLAQVKVYAQGSGQITVNGEDITYFKDYMHRQTVLTPLQLIDGLDKYDVEATVTGEGMSAQAGAVRLGISRALVSLVPKDMVIKLRIAGLLTRDPRMRERYKPGQEKARRKFTWKKR